MYRKQNENNRGERDSGKKIQSLDRKIVNLVGDESGDPPVVKAPDAAMERNFQRAQEEHRQFLRRMRIQSIHRRIVEVIIAGSILLISMGITFFLVPNIM